MHHGRIALNLIGISPDVMREVGIRVNGSLPLNLRRRSVTHHRRNDQPISRAPVLDPRLERHQYVALTITRKVILKSLSKLIRSRPAYYMGQARHDKKTKKRLGLFPAPIRGYYALVIICRCLKRSDRIGSACIHQDFSTVFGKMAEVGIVRIKRMSQARSGVLQVAIKIKFLEIKANT